MAIVKSKLLKQLSDNYPNFLKKDLEKFTNVTGKSAIFIQYSQVRAKRLLEQRSKKLKLENIQENERPLVIELIKFSYWIDKFEFFSIAQDLRYYDNCHSESIHIFVDDQPFFLILLKNWHMV